MPNVDFVALVQREFGFLTNEYGFGTRSPEDGVVVYDSPTCEVRIALERRDLFVDIRSREKLAFNQMHLSLCELVRLESPRATLRSAHSGESLAAPGEPSLRDWVKSAARLLEHHGHAVLSGDPGFRKRLIQQQIGELLERWFEYVAEYETVELAIRQIQFEYRQLTTDRRAVAWRLLGQWMDGDDAERSRFVETIVSVL
jgi:hypothetical protein